MRAEDPQKWGDSISSDPLVKRALLGTETSSVNVREGVLAPSILISSAAAVRDSANHIVGSVVVGLVADNAFVDSIKGASGLDSAVYAGNMRSATTFVAPDGHSRWIGVKEENALVKDQVLKQGNIFKGTVEVLNRPFLAVYSPIKDVDNQVIGMFFIGRSEGSILASAGQTIELTFIVAVILLALAIFPAFWTARFLSKQLS